MGADEVFLSFCHFVKTEETRLSSFRRSDPSPIRVRPERRPGFCSDMIVSVCVRNIKPIISPRCFQIRSLLI